jgi:hypothetical protein
MFEMTKGTTTMGLWGDILYNCNEENVTQSAVPYDDTLNWSKTLRLIKEEALNKGIGPEQLLTYWRSSLLPIIEEDKNRKIVVSSKKLRLRQ